MSAGSGWSFARQWSDYSSCWPSERPAPFVRLYRSPAALSVRALSSLWFPLQIGLAFYSRELALSLWAVCISPTSPTTASTGTPGRLRSALVCFIRNRTPERSVLLPVAGCRESWFQALPGSFPYLSPERVTLITACGIAALAILPYLRSSHLKVALAPARPRLIVYSCLEGFYQLVGRHVGVVTGSFSPFANVFLSVHLSRDSLTQVGTVSFFIVPGFASRYCSRALLFCSRIPSRNILDQRGLPWRHASSCWHLAAIQCIRAVCTLC